MQRPTTRPPGEPPRPSRKQRGWRWFDGVLLAGVLALLLFPVAARLAADAQPISPPTKPQLPPLPARGAGGTVRSLPAFATLSSVRVATLFAAGRPAEIHVAARLARGLYGPRIGAALMRAVRGDGPTPSLPAVPRSRLARENDLAALLIVSGATPGYNVNLTRPGFGAAGPVALRLLQGAVRGGGCDAWLNLGFLLAADSNGLHPTAVAADLQHAAAACPSDPTALWTLGEYQSELAAAGQLGHGAPLATFAALERRFPRVAAAWSGQADAEMRLGYADETKSPFTARARFRLAVGLYRRAASLAPGAGAWAGQARALAAANEPAAAVAAQRRAVAFDPRSAALAVRLLDYLQRDHAFGEAAAEAGAMAALHPLTPTPDLLPDPDLLDYVTDEDETMPLSLGVAAVTPAHIAVTFNNQTLPATAADVSYIPTYVPMSGVGGDARWCPAWSRLVDLLLTGHPAAILRAFTTRYPDLRRGASDCFSSGFLDAGASELTAIADLELGDVAAARKWARHNGLDLSTVENLRQNLWRYAGKFAQAAAAAGAWARTLPQDASAIEEEGEIAFLQHRYQDAAVDFAQGANDDQWKSGTWSTPEANALLDQGTAAAYAGRGAEALALLAQAAETAIRANAGQTGNNIDKGAAILATYAQEAAGNTLLNMQQPAQAAEDYVAALGSAARIDPSVSPPPGSDRLRRDVLDNNAAIADVATGRDAAGVALADAAISIDPGDAIFWWTKAYAEQELGQRTTALADYRAALARDPTEYPVANNIGVLLLDRGDTAAAVNALRRSVGANPSYALGWFNLGVALGRRGPTRVFAAQGSLARARTLDPGLGSRAPQPILDNTVYITHLDLSKPIPPTWTFARSQSRAPVAAAGLSAILLLVVGLARSLSGRVSSVVKPEQWLPLIARVSKRMPRGRWLEGPALALVATVACLLWPLHSGPTGGSVSVAVYAIGILILIALVLRVRQIAAARAGLQLTQETWMPGVWLGLVLTAAGLGWAPLPVVRAKAKAVTVHWAGPTAVAALAIALLVLAVWLNVPLTRSLGAAALVMAASLLTPVKPLDGATVSASPAGALPGVAVLGTAVLVVAGLL